jgi:hypothetical protein
MLRKNLQYRLDTIIGKLFSMIFLCLLFIPGANAQNVWILDVAGTLPTGYLDAGVLKEMTVGDTFNLRVDRSSIYPIQIEEVRFSDNGDQSWYGSINNTGLDYAMVITAGERTAHIILTSPSGIFQLYGRKSGEDRYSGAFTKLEHVRDDVATTDLILPAGGGSRGSLDGVFSDILIVQEVSDFIAPLGSTLTFNITFSNLTSEAKSELYADVFFLLENTNLIDLPESCELLESTDLQPVLSCFLGDMAANEKRQLSYSVATTEESHPLVYSTIVVDDDRSDVIVELYRDVVADSDEDGISDFNESLLGSDAFNGLENLTEPTAVIDVLVAYTAEIDNLYLGETQTRINHLFNVANKIFADSNTGIFLRPVGVHEVNYSPSDDLFDDLSALTFQSDDAFESLGRMRNFYGGDLTVLFRTGEENGLCGLANLGGQGTQGDLSADYHKDFAYSVINIDCLDDSVLAHEVGHNLGLVHSRREDSAGGTFSYSAGFGEDTRFVTMMAFPDDFDVVNRLYRFSDPLRACGQFQCGADKDAIEGADSVSTLNTVKYQVADYYSAQEERISTIKPVSNLSGVINSLIGLEAYSSSGLSFERSFSGGEKINFRMKITPLPSQVGKEFVTHLVVLQGKNSLYQLTGNGELTPWSGRLNSLEAISESRVMGDTELFDIVKELDFQAADISGPVNIFVAYRMSETGELVYITSPLRISLN